MDDKPFLSQVKGFTPVIDVLANELSTMTALVYGIVWRYCQMDDKVCRATRETIAAHANISTKTVQRHLYELVEKGYLEDTTPGVKHKPHIYKDTGKVQIIGLVEARMVGGTESPTFKEGETESPTKEDRESRPGRTESPIKKESSKKLLEERKNITPSDFGIGQTNPLDGVPQATDGHQRAVDTANGGEAKDPTTEVARHLRWLCDGYGEELPEDKNARAPYLKAARQLLGRTNAKDDWQGVCAAIDDWGEDPPEDDVWWRNKTKSPSYAIDHLTTHYCQGKNGGKSKKSRKQQGNDSKDEYTNLLVQRGKSQIAAAMESEQ